MACHCHGCFGAFGFSSCEAISTNTSKMNALVLFGEEKLFEVFTKFFLWLVVDGGFLFLFELISFFLGFPSFHLSFETN